MLKHKIWFNFPDVIDVKGQTILSDARKYPIHQEETRGGSSLEEGDSQQNSILGVVTTKDLFKVFSSESQILYCEWKTAFQNTDMFQPNEKKLDYG